jgi:histidine triad (HIT) family protein
MCIFCKIIKKEIKSDIVYEDGEVLAFKDINPVAPIHILVIPKRHIESIDKLEEADAYLVGKLCYIAKKIAEGVFSSEISSPRGYKLLFRVGEWGGQEVPHIHLHLIGGAKLDEKIGPIIKLEI